MLNFDTEQIFLFNRIMGALFLFGILTIRFYRYILFRLRKIYH